MVKIALVIASVRSMLGDSDGANYRYSTAEILNALRLGLTEISQDSLPFRKIWLVEIKENQRRYELPNDFIRFINNKKNVVDNDNEWIEWSDSQTFFIKPNWSNERVLLRLYHNYFETIYDEDTNLKIDDGFALPLTYFALHLLFMSPNRENGLNMSEFYYAKYKEALVLPLHHSKLTSLKNRDRTEYRRV